MSGKRRLKQSYVAFRLGITINSYANIERGRVNITLDKLAQLAEIFGLKAHQMLALSEEISPVEEIKGK